MVPVTDDAMLLCHRCGAELHPGRGDFYVVRIDAFADPTPPVLTEDDLNRDLRAEIEGLVESLEGLSEQEAVDQVHRRLILHLCVPCYRLWIEDPVP